MTVTGIPVTGILSALLRMTEAPPLPTPLTVFRGAEDPFVRAEHTAAWAGLSSLSR